MKKKTVRIGGTAYPVGRGKTFEKKKASKQMALEDKLAAHKGDMTLPEVLKSAGMTTEDAKERLSKGKKE